MNRVIFSRYRRADERGIFLSGLVCDAIGEQRCRRIVERHYRLHHAYRAQDCRRPHQQRRGACGELAVHVNETPT